MVVLTSDQFRTLTDGSSSMFSGGSGGPYTAIDIDNDIQRPIAIDIDNDIQRPIANDWFRVFPTPKSNIIINRKYSTTKDCEGSNIWDHCCQR